MNVETLLENLKYTGHLGHIVSTEESLILYNSLLILQNENHFRNVFFWGKINGIEKDYYIAFGYKEDALIGRVYYYSTDCFNWGLLPKPTDLGLILTPFCTDKFDGDPALCSEIRIDKDEITVEEEMKAQLYLLKEEDRLAATVHFVTIEAAVVPRGALFKRPDGVVIENVAFEGLSQMEAREIISFLHYRPPTQKHNTNLLTREDYNYAMDFLGTNIIMLYSGFQLTCGGGVIKNRTVCVFYPEGLKSGEYGHDEPEVPELDVHLLQFVLDGFHYNFYSFLLASLGQLLLGGRSNICAPRLYHRTHRERIG